MDPKRKRATNFSKEEELQLLEEVIKHKNVIECKTTNKISTLEKENAWKKILCSLNSRSMKPRTIEQLKSKYDNLKTKAKKEVAQQKTYFKKTGGGPCSSNNDPQDPVTEAVLNIINYKTVIGLKSKADSDAIDDDERQVLLNLNNSNNSLIPPFETEIPNEEFEGITMQNSIFSSEITPPLQKNYAAPSNLPDVHPNVREIQEKENVKSADRKWNKYTPKMLKKSVSAKLRPTMANTIYTAKEEYYKRKLKWLEDNENIEKAEREKRGKRDEEIHERELIFLDLKIELKRKKIKLIDEM